MKHTQRFLWLDLIRGLSALEVCAYHLKLAVLTDYLKLQETSFLQKVFYAMTGLGSQSVMVFFVLSGFFVGGSVLKNGKTFKWLDYAIARLSRLWVVLIPALLITFILDWILEARSPGTLAGIYSQIWSSGPGCTGAEYSSSLVTFLGNVFFLQTIFTPIFGTNGPLWSLANEFWYYVTFPLCAYAVGQCYDTNKPSLTSRIAIGLIATALIILLPSAIRLDYFVWLLGVLVYIVVNRLKETSLPLLILTFSIFVSSIVYSKSPALQAILHLPVNLTIGLGFFLFCCALVKLPVPSNLNPLFVKCVRGLSESSYSLYLSHFPLVLLIGVSFYGSNKLMPNLIGFAHFFSWLGFLLAVGAVFWWFFERKSPVVRKLVMERLHR